MKKKLISSLKAEDVQVKGRFNLSKHIREHFMQHFKQPSLPKITLAIGVFRKIDTNHALLLESILSEDKIMTAIKSGDL